MSLWGPGYFSNRTSGGYGPSPPWNASGLGIDNVGNPEEGDDAVTKDYVDNVAILNYDGYIPPMSQNSSQTGFVASASTAYNALYQPYMAFAPSWSHRPLGMNGRRVDKVLEPGYRFSAPQLCVFGKLGCEAELLILNASPAGTSPAPMEARLQLF